LIHVDSTERPVVFSMKKKNKSDRTLHTFTQWAVIGDDTLLNAMIGKKKENDVDES
jgi:hypothetical protein